MASRHDRAGRRIPYRALAQRGTPIEWLSDEGLRDGGGRKASAARRAFVAVWRWGRWIGVVLASPLMLIGYWFGMLLMFVALCPLLVCIGQPKVVVEMVKELPLLPPNWRAVLTPPRTGLARRAFGVVARWW